MNEIRNAHEADLLQQLKLEHALWIPYFRFTPTTRDPSHLISIGVQAVPKRCLWRVPIIMMENRLPPVGIIPEEEKSDA